MAAQHYVVWPSSICHVHAKLFWLIPAGLPAASEQDALCHHHKRPCMADNMLVHRDCMYGLINCVGALCEAARPD